MSTSYLSVADVAMRWRVSKMTVYRLINENALSAVCIGRQKRITEAEYERYSAVNTNMVPEQAQAS